MMLFVLYTSDPLTYAEFVKNIVLALMLPFTSNDVLGVKGLFMVTDENLAELVMMFTALILEDTAMLCVLIDMARTLETVATFMNVE
jgi:hypothetical protein